MLLLSQGNCDLFATFISTEKAGHFESAGSFILLLPLVITTGATLAHAQGGPPFITDDPGTPGNRHWEINIGWIADHNPGLAYYQIPDIDMNYGWGDRIQLKYELPLAAAHGPE